MAARSVVRDALGRLTDKARLTVTLFYIDGYSHAEIADFLEVPVNTVRSRLRHAKKRLREEMMTMVADVLNEGKPDPGLTRRAVQQAMERAEEALQSRSRAQAIRHYDEALTVLEKMKPDGEHRRLKMHALRQKGLACEFPPFDKGRTQLYEEALAIARQLGDREMQADLLRKLGDVEKSLELYRELGKLGEQGICLRLMGFEHLGANEVEQGRRCYEQAIPLFEEARALDGVTLCRAMLDLLDEVGEKRFRKLLLWEVGCHGLEKNRALTHLFVHWNSGGDLPDEPPDPWPFVDVFPEVSHLGKFLDPRVPVGGSWSGNTDTYSFQPLRATVTVKSNSERLTVPAGTFEHCLLTEQVTTESGLPDHAPERNKQFNCAAYLGTRLAWYAPGVGLAQMHVQRADGTEATLQLEACHMQRRSKDYLPLSVGSWWSYGRPDTPKGYVAEQTYRVAASKRAVRYLEHRIYLYKL